MSKNLQDKYNYLQCKYWIVLGALFDESGCTGIVNKSPDITELERIATCLPCIDREVVRETDEFLAWLKETEKCEDPAKCHVEHFNKVIKQFGRECKDND